MLGQHCIPLQQDTELPYGQLYVLSKDPEGYVSGCFLLRYAITPFFLPVITEALLHPRERQLDHGMLCAVNSASMSRNIFSPVAGPSQIALDNTSEFIRPVDVSNVRTTIGSCLLLSSFDPSVDTVNTWFLILVTISVWRICANSLTKPVAFFLPHCNSLSIWLSGHIFFTASVNVSAAVNGKL